MEALDGQMVAKALNSSDNHNPKLAVKSCRKIAHDDPAVSFGVLQDVVGGLASNLVKNDKIRLEVLIHISS